MSDWDEMVLVGRIARAHGNRGQVIVDPATDFPEERFKAGSVLHIRRADFTEPVTVEGRTYDAVKLAHEREGIEGNTYHSVITSWRDVATGINLKVVERQISGQYYGPSTTWHALRVEPLR